MAEWLKEWKIEFVIIVAMLILIVLSIKMAVDDERQWVAFRDSHQCRVVGEMAGSLTTGTGISSKGEISMVTTVEPDKIGWLCSDGKTYWRNK